MVKVKAVDDCVWMKPGKHLVEVPVATPGGVYLPVMDDDVPRLEVVAVGPGKWGFSGAREPVGVSVGDVVSFAGDAQVVWLDGEQYFVARGYQVMGVLEAGVRQTARRADRSAAMMVPQ